MTDDAMERRQAYAEEVAAIGGLTSDALIKAFGEVSREDFLPPGPWTVERLDGTYYVTPDCAPSRILHAVGICLDLSSGLNTGNPARIGPFLQDVDIRPGETVFHVGAGLGYFSAIMSRLVGASGQVIAAEIDPELRAQARRNLAAFPNVAVVDDAFTVALPAVDVIFASAGLTRIPRPWIQSLRLGGRMLLPLTGAMNSGFIFLFHKGGEGAPLSARRCSFMRFYPCAGGRDSAGMRVLDEALADSRANGGEPLKLRLDPHQRDAACWLHQDDYCVGL